MISKMNKCMQNDNKQKKEQKIKTDQILMSNFSHKMDTIITKPTKNVQNKSRSTSKSSRKLIN